MPRRTFPSIQKKDWQTWERQNAQVGTLALPKAGVERDIGPGQNGLWPPGLQVVVANFLAGFG